MMLSRASRMILTTLLLAVVAVPAAAQQAAGEGGEGPFDLELWSALRGRYEAGLRQHVALTDAQVAAIMPQVEALEGHRRTARRERARTTNKLRIAFEQGGTDPELQALLDRLDEIEVSLRREERRIQQAIDAELTVRQRVKFRYFSVKFRAELRRRLGALRGEDGPRRRPLLERMRELRNRRDGGGG